MKKLKVAVLTTNRADYGLLYYPMKAIEAHPALELLVIAAGAHLSRQHGYSLEKIEADGFEVAHKIEALQPEGDDSAHAAAQAAARASLCYADAYRALKPDLLMVLGDRFEVLAACQTALIMSLPIAHIAGGDLTLGAFDDSFRHAITKLSHIHFPTNARAARLLVQMGEEPERVHMVGSPGIDYIKSMRYLNRQQLEESLSIKLRKKILLTTFHPETLSGEWLSALSNLLKVLSELDQDHSLIFTAPNNDPGGAEARKLIETFVAERSNAHLFENLGSTRYLSLMSLSNCVVGNSSSGLYEAPALKVATLNIGDRQADRLSASSVVNTGGDIDSIRQGLTRALSLDCSETVSPYGDGSASQRIIDVLANIAQQYDLGKLLRKRFHHV
jgi:UDP-N-acetylglucosamine 2-epimerase (non-hydrolysing)/GDP/UDP-N,N'-diacetylbacillosamine 2-epimerase (hydrolysing)